MHRERTPTNARLLSTLGSKFAKSKVDISVPDACNAVIDSNTLSLKRSSGLLYGIVLVFKRKTDLNYRETSNVKMKLMKSFDVSLPLSTKRALNVMGDDPGFDIDWAAHFIPEHPSVNPTEDVRSSGLRVAGFSAESSGIADPLDGAPDIPEFHAGYDAPMDIGVDPGTFPGGVSSVIADIGALEEIPVPDMEIEEQADMVRSAFGDGSVASGDSSVAFSEVPLALQANRRCAGYKRVKYNPVIAFTTAELRESRQNYLERLPYSPSEEGPVEEWWMKLANGLSRHTRSSSMTSVEAGRGRSSSVSSIEQGRRGSGSLGSTPEPDMYGFEEPENTIDIEFDQALTSISFDDSIKVAEFEKQVLDHGKELVFDDLTPASKSDAADKFQMLLQFASDGLISLGVCDTAIGLSKWDPLAPEDVGIVVN